jgi:diketogulonate reductase-like aldo/keto reductase
LGELARPLWTPEPTLKMVDDGSYIPQLAFGLYKVPATAEGEEIIRMAVKAGYRHFDTASYYGNEAVLGRALKQSGIPREYFFVCSKVWNDAQKRGRAAVRESVEKSLVAFGFGGYFDLMLVHWPVPGHYVETYKELECLKREGKVRSIGISNFSPSEYEVLEQSGKTVRPAVNQFEVSPFMFRKDDVKYLQDRGVLVSA